MVHEASPEKIDSASVFRRAWLLPELETTDLPEGKPARQSRLATALAPAAAILGRLHRKTDDMARSFPLLELFAVAALSLALIAHAFLR